MDSITHKLETLIFERTTGEVFPWTREELLRALDDVRLSIPRQDVLRLENLIARRCQAMR